jgi:hypothetical protein
VVDDFGPRSGFGVALTSGLVDVADGVALVGPGDPEGGGDDDPVGVGVGEGAWGDQGSHEAPVAEATPREASATSAVHATATTAARRG